jgi:accessory colonization factor AcfC
MSNATQGLRVVGPGGPYEAMVECAEAFSRTRNVTVEVIKGPPERWLDRRADLIYGGFPLMLTALAEIHPEALSTIEIHELYARRIGLLVRRGNPRHLLTLADLAREGIQVLDVQLEQMQEFQDRVPGLRARLAALVRTGEEGIQVWRARPELDAWITFESWYRATSSETDFIPLADDIGALRPTVIAMTRWTARRTLAREFISFSAALALMTCSAGGDGSSVPRPPRARCEASSQGQVLLRAPVQLW